MLTSFTSKIGKHTKCGYSLYTNYSFDNIKDMIFTAVNLFGPYNRASARNI